MQIPDDNRTPIEVRQVNGMIGNCLSAAVKDAMLTISLNGGYNRLPLNRVETMAGQMPFYYDSGIVSIPDVDTIEDEMLQSVMDYLPLCIRLEIFQKEGQSIETGDIAVELEISDDIVHAQMKYPVTISDDDSVHYLDSFNRSQRFLISRIDESIQEIVWSIADDPYRLDLSQFQDNYFEVSHMNHDPCIDLYIIDDDESLENEFLQFRFAVRYPDSMCSELQEQRIPENYTFDNEPPVLAEIGPQQAAVGTEFRLNVSATDPDSDMVFYLAEGIIEKHIDTVTGEIIWTPEEPGSFIVKVIAVDINGDIDSEDVLFKVSP
jgi:hypothetical protein